MGGAARGYGRGVSASNSNLPPAAGRSAHSRPPVVFLDVVNTKKPREFRGAQSMKIPSYSIRPDYAARVAVSTTASGTGPQM
jgi:hypothetical protein